MIYQKSDVSCTGANPPRPGGFPGANSPGPVADLYGPSSQDSAVGNYISAASPQPGSGFNHSLAVSTALLHYSVMSIILFNYIQPPAEKSGSDWLFLHCDSLFMARARLSAQQFRNVELEKRISKELVPFHMFKNTPMSHESPLDWHFMSRWCFVWGIKESQTV